MYGADRLKEWERQQRLLEQRRQQWQANQQRVASLRTQSNKPAPKQSFFNKVRDTFDANTQADQYRREQKGQARLYADQQKDMGRTRISNNPFQRGTNTFRSLAETIKQPYEGLGKGISTAFGEGASLRDYEAKTQQENLAHVENLRKQLAKPTTSLADRAVLRSRIGIASTAAQNSYNRQIAQTQQLERDADPRKQAGNIVQIGTDLAGLGVAGFAGKEFGTNAAKLGFRQATKKALPAIGQNAALNVVQGGAGELQSNDPTMAGALRKAALGGAIGTVADLTLGGFAALPSNRAYKNVVKELANETDGAVVRDTVKEIANDLPEETIDDISKQITKATDEATVDGIIKKAALEEGQLTNPIRKTFEPLEQVPTSGTVTKDPSIIYGFKQAKTPEQARDSVKVLFPELDDKAVNKASQELAQATDDNAVYQALERAQAQRKAVTEGVDNATPTGELAPTPEQQLAEAPASTAPIVAKQAPDADIQANQVVQSVDEAAAPVSAVQDAVAPLADGERYTTTNADISFGSDSSGGTVSYKPDGAGTQAKQVSYNQLSEKTRTELITAEQNYARARANSKGFVKPGTRGEVQIAKEQLDIAQSNAIEELGLQDYANKVDSSGNVIQKTYNDRYTDWAEAKYKSLNPDEREIFAKDAVANPEKYKAQFEAEYRSTFYDSLDVPKEDLIIRDGSGKAMSIDPKAPQVGKTEGTLKSAEDVIKENSIREISVPLVGDQKFKVTRVKVSDLLKRDTDLAEYVKTNPGKSRFYKNQEPTTALPVIGKRVGEPGGLDQVIDGYGRIKQAVDDGKEYIDVNLSTDSDLNSLTPQPPNTVAPVANPEKYKAQVESDRIADALGIPKADRTPTADAQVAGRVEMAMAKGLSGDMTPQQIKAELRARNGNKPTTARSLKEKPAKQTFEQVTKEYQGNTGAARIDRQSTIADLQKRYKLSKEEKLNAILAIDDPSVQPISDQVAQLTQEYKQLTDSAYRAYTGKGINMGYVESYLPRIYKNPETGQLIDRAEYELLQQGSSRTRGREADKVATNWLVEKDPVKLLERYYDSMDRTVAGKAYLSKLEDNGLVIASTDMVPGLRPVVAEGLQAGNGMVYYANKDVANKLNTLFGSKEANNIVEAALDKAKGVNSLFQSVILSGGIPNTPLNAFGVMQVLKETMALHPYKAGKALIAGLSKDFANNLFTKKKDILKLMAENDIDVRVDLTQTGKYGRERTKDAFKDQGIAGGINQAWNEFTNDSTFGRFMPALEVLHFENIYKAARGRGASIADASALAAESTKNFYGKTSVFKQSVRSKAVDDAAGAFLFAPRFRESMLNFWGKNAQAAIPTNWGKVAYRDNQKFLAASAATFAAMTSLNESLNGVQMWDNPDGKKDKLIIPAAALDKLGINTNGKDVAIPFLPSLSTVPRNIGMGAYNFAVGNDEEGWKNVKSFASIPISLGMDVATNEDYFGSKIVEDGTPALDKRVQQGTYLLKNAMQPWIREGLNIAGQKLPENVKAKLGIKEKSGVESASNALELPFRFYNPKYYNYDKQFVPGGKEGEKFTFAEQRDRAKIGKEIKGIPDSLGLNKRQKAAYAKLNAVEFNDDGTLKEDSNPFYKVQRYSDLQDDKVFEAVKQRAKLNAKLNGKPIDPIFSESVAPEQRRVLLWKKTLPPGTSDPTVKKLYEQDWYLDYQNKERAYYDQKKAWNKEMGYKEPPQSTNPYPEASPELQKSMDFYFTLPKGTGARSSWIKGNGGVWNQMINYWESKDAWTNGERAKVGLGNVDDEKSGGSGGGKFGYSKGGKSGSGGGGSGKGAKLKTPKTYITELLGNVPNISSDEIAIRTAPKRAKFKVKTPGGKGRNYKKIKLS